MTYKNGKDFNSKTLKRDFLYKLNYFTYFLYSNIFKSIFELLFVKKMFFVKIDIIQRCCQLTVYNVQ